VRVVYVVAVALALAAGIDVVVPRAGTGAALSGLPTAPTVSYAIPPAAPRTSLRAAVARLSPNVIDSNTEWFILMQRAAGTLQTAPADAAISALRSDARVDLRHARYVLLSDTSPVVPMGPLTTLPPLRRQPVWLVPIDTLRAPPVPGRHEYLVLDAQSGAVLERLVVESIDPLAPCRAGSPGVLGTGWLLCALAHSLDARAAAQRSAP
jgi:hypothetical protein